MLSHLSADSNSVVVPLNLGGPIYVCSFCNAQMWFEERLKKPMRDGVPRFVLCCIEGKVQLPALKKTSTFFDRLMDYKGGRPSKSFRDNIRIYNSMFQFTSIGGKVDMDINKRSDRMCLECPIKITTKLVRWYL